MITYGPAGFEAYARLRFIPDPTYAGQRGADVELPDDHRSDIETTRRAVAVLEQFTATPDDCYFCVWEGYSDVRLPTAAGDAWVVLPHRRYALFRGAPRDLESWETCFGAGDPIAPPAFVWPHDRSWCFASDVDPHGAGIGGPARAIAALLATQDLDVVRADPTASTPRY